jgi:DNA-binding NtrC family response regulator
MKSSQLRPTIAKLVETAIDSHIEVPELLNAVERECLEQLLALHGNNQCTVARVLGIHRNTMHRRLAAVGVDVTPPRRNWKGYGKGIVHV